MGGIFLSQVLATAAAVFACGMQMASRGACTDIYSPSKPWAAGRVCWFVSISNLYNIEASSPALAKAGMHKKTNIWLGYYIMYGDWSMVGFHLLCWTLSWKATDDPPAIKLMINYAACPTGNQEPGVYVRPYLARCMHCILETGEFGSTHVART